MNAITVHPDVVRPALSCVEAYVNGASRTQRILVFKQLFGDTCLGCFSDKKSCECVVPLAFPETSDYSDQTQPTDR